MRHPAHRPPRTAPHRPCTARRGRMARSHCAHREHDSARRSAHHGPRHLRKDPARTGGGAGDVAVEIRPVVHVGREARTHRARAAPLPEGSSALRGPAGQRPRDSPRREPRPCAAHPLAPQRAHERRRPRGLRLAARVRAHDGGRVPRHRRGRPVAAPGLLVRPDPLLVQLLHLRVALGPAPRGGASPGPLRKNTRSSNGASPTRSRPHGSICRS